MKEVFKDIPGYPNYQVSNYGNIKSLPRKIKTKGDVWWLTEERILKPGKDKKSYFIVALCEKNKKRTHYIHRLVWDYFGKGERDGLVLQIDHIDNNKHNNKITNLRLVTNRLNCAKGWLLKKTTSKYTGVSWHKFSKTWRSDIYINSKSNFLGYFKTELEASEAYQEALKGLGNDIEA